MTMELKRPTIDSAHGSSVTTPIAATMMQLLGAGYVSGSVAFTRDEWRAIKRLYGFVPEKPNSRPPPPEKPAQEQFKTAWEYDQAVREHERAMKAWEAWKDPRSLMRAGADRNAIRYAEADGLRLLAWIARYLTLGEDPLRQLVQLAIDAGWDVDPADCAWAAGEEPGP